MPIFKIVAAVSALTVFLTGTVSADPHAPATRAVYAEVYGPPAPVVFGPPAPQPLRRSGVLATGSIDRAAKAGQSSHSTEWASSPLLAAAIKAEIERERTGLDPAVEADHKALAAFYAERDGQPLWVTDQGLTARGKDLIAEIENGAAYGLTPSLIRVPKFERTVDVEELAVSDYDLSLAALKYAYHARGGRIHHPSKQLNSNLDRKPQLHKRSDVLAKLATATDVKIALQSLHPVHPQFEKLRQAFLKASGDGKGAGKLGLTAKRLRANMEFWRWMWDDLGDMYVFNNIPEFMQYVIHDDQVVRTARVVVGQTSKPTSVFSRPLKHVVLRPQWRVPESIMVHELWPSLLRGGGYMRQYGLNITTKSGEPRDWQRIDWTKDDIRNYHVWQPPGRRSVLGDVKFSFPSQHTIFMHDTPDKWMFRSRQRTLSHGCLRVKDPLELAEIVLQHDRGWDMTKIKSLLRSGPRNNEIRMQKHIPIHMAYFTAWADDAGKVKVFRDIYGHERRVREALDGDWDKIDKGRNHLAPVKRRFSPKAISRASPNKRRPQKESVGNLISDALSLGF